MFKGESYLLEILTNVGDIKGRKKFQKIVHLLENKGMEPIYRYKYYHYGPYSSDLQLEIDLLVHKGLVKEEFENGTYSYKITDKGTEFKEKVSAYNNINIDKDLLIKLNEKDASFLELLSTYVFLRDYGRSEDEAKEETLKLKPHLKGYMDKVLSFYRESLLN